MAYPDWMPVLRCVFLLDKQSSGTPAISKRKLITHFALGAKLGSLNVLADVLWRRLGTQYPSPCLSTVRNTHAGERANDWALFVQLWTSTGLTAVLSSKVQVVHCTCTIQVYNCGYRQIHISPLLSNGENSRSTKNQFAYWQYHTIFINFWERRTLINFCLCIYHRRLPQVYQCWRWSSSCRWAYTRLTVFPFGEDIQYTHSTKKIKKDLIYSSLSPYSFSSSIVLLLLYCEQE